MKSFKVIDVQDRYYESLNAGLFKLDEKILPDPLIRISDNVDILFEMKRLDLVAQHNEVCLLSTRKIFKNRYLKLNLLSTNRVRMKKAKRIEKKVIIEDSIEGKVYKIIKENGTRGITFKELLVKSHVSEIELKNCIRKLLWENIITEIEGFFIT